MPQPDREPAASTDRPARPAAPPNRLPPLLLLLLLLLHGLGLGLLACGDDDRRAADPEPADIPAPQFPAVTDETLSAGAGEDWPTTGGNLANQRYSPLDQINRQTVRELVPVWVHSTGIEGALETTPIVVGNTMYVTTAGGRVLALNAATGEALWSVDPAPERVTLCCGPTNQGVAAYAGMVYVLSPDARLLALDARNGAELWERELADPGEGYSAVMAPLAVGGRVFAGVSGERYGIRGFLAAFHAETGEELWRWHTIPSEEAGGWWGEFAPADPFGTPLNRDLQAEREAAAGSPGSWAAGGGGIATTPAYDAESGMLYVNVEGPAPLASGAGRPGDNLYTGSIVALDATSGERVWHAQYLPHDVWGLSGGSPPFLFDRGDRRLVAFAGRTGWVYVFDARSGEPVLRSDNFVPQEGLFARSEGEGEGVRVAPGANGGNAGGPVAVNPGAGVVYVGGVHQPMVYVPESGSYRPGELWVGGRVRFSPGDDHWGTVTAIDLGSGEIRWQRRTPTPVHSGALTTAGGLVFIGQGGGAIDAFDAENGQLLWQFRTGAGVHGGPVTYSVAGVQYVVVAAGGSHHFDTPEGDDIIAFALASHRPPAGLRGYQEPGYERGGPATPGAGGVHQLQEEQVAPDTTADAERARRDTTTPADTASDPPAVPDPPDDDGPPGAVDGNTPQG